MIFLQILFQYIFLSSGSLSYEMLMLIGMDALDLVAWLVVTGFATGLMLRFWVGLGGANQVGIGVLFLLVHFLQIGMLIRKMARAITIMVAGDVNVQ